MTQEPRWSRWTTVKCWGDRAKQLLRRMNNIRLLHQLVIKYWRSSLNSQTQPNNISKPIKRSLPKQSLNRWQENYIKNFLPLPDGKQSGFTGSKVALKHRAPSTLPSGWMMFSSRIIALRRIRCCRFSLVVS